MSITFECERCGKTGYVPSYMSRKPSWMKRCKDCYFHKVEHVREQEIEDTERQDATTAEYERQKDVWMVQHNMNSLYKRAWKMNGKIYTDLGVYE